VDGFVPSKKVARIVQLLVGLSEEDDSIWQYFEAGPVTVITGLLPFTMLNNGACKTVNVAEEVVSTPNLSVSLTV